MPKPLSPDLRYRVMDACDEGLSPEEAAEQFSVGVRTIYDWIELRNETGGLAPRSGKRGRKLKLGPHVQQLTEAVRSKPDATLNELLKDLPVPVGITTLHNMLGRLGLTRKKEGHPRRRATAT